MRLVLALTLAALTVAANDAALAEAKKGPYPTVKVEVAEAPPPDEALERMRKALVEAVAKKDAKALFALVAPTFVWLTQGSLNDQFDLGRDALHNFKVVLGFREFGHDVDGGVTEGPFWDTLAAFAADDVYYSAGGSLVCGPTIATIVDEDVFETAQNRLGDDSTDWYFTIAATTATAKPGGGPQVGKVGQVALPILDVHPPAQEGQDQPITHVQVLLPSGRNGWIPLAAVRPFTSDRLCYAATPAGEWKIAAFDSAE
ncbi:MAG: hypothetical protein ACRECO_05245 [Xanthobacteraceae bacterium]